MRTRGVALAFTLILTMLGGGAALASSTVPAARGHERATDPAPSAARTDDAAADAGDQGREDFGLFGLQEPDEASYITVDGRVFTGDEPVPFQPPGTALLRADLSGANEVDAEGDPGAGDPDGTGTAELELTFEPAEVCATLSVENIALPATGAHIHRGEAGVNGPIVVGLPVPGEDGTAEGCVTEGATTGLLEEIAENPASFYVNVHNAEFPAGAVRGQLEQDPDAVIPSPGDRTVFRERLFALDETDPDDPQPKGDQIGAVLAECTAITMGVAPEDQSFTCVSVFTLDDRGDIAVQDSFTFADPLDDLLAITGGTGSYRDAGGEIAFSAEPIENSDLFNSVYHVRLLHLR